MNKPLKILCGVLGVIFLGAVAFTTIFTITNWDSVPYARHSEREQNILALTTQVATLQTQLSAQNATVLALTGINAELNAAMGEMDGIITDLSIAIANYQITHAHSEFIIVTLSGNVGDLHTQIALFQSLNQTLATQVAELEIVIIDLEIVIESNAEYGALIATLSTQVGGLNTQITGLNATITENISTISTLETQVENLQTQVTALSEIIDGYLVTQIENQEIITDLNGRLTSALAQVATLTTTNQNLVAELATQANTIVEMQGTINHYRGLLANFEAFAVVFLNGAGGVFNLQSVMRGANAITPVGTPPPAPSSPANIAFDGWSVQGNAAIINPANIVITAHTTFVPQWRFTGAL